MTALHDPPGPQGRWLTGHLRAYAHDPLGFLTACFRQYGDVVRLRFVNIPVYLVSRPDLLESVLVTQRDNFIRGRTRRTMRLVFGNGLLLSEGEQWHRQRQLWHSAFRREHLDLYGEKLAGCARKILATLPDHDTRDIYQWMSHLTLAALGETLVQADLGAHADRIRTALEILLEHYADLTLFSILLPDRFPTPATLRAQRALRELERIVYAIIRERRSGGDHARDFLSLLAAAQQGDQSRTGLRQLRDELMTLLLVGHETSAVTLSWCWYLLSQHPEIEARLTGELQNVVGDRPPGPVDLPHLPYAEAVVLESLRLYPPIYAFGREAVRDCEIGGYRVPAGASIFFSQWVMHRDPRYFDRPDEFLPGRWINGSARRLPKKHAYLPFGAGPRSCIGAGFAMMEIVLLLAAIAQKFRVQVMPGHTVVPQASFTLRPRNRIPAVLSRRPACSCVPR